MKKQLFFIFVFQIIGTTVGAVPPKEIPTELFSQFTMNGLMSVAHYYFDNSYPPEHPLIYVIYDVENLKAKAMARKENYYMATDSYLYAALDKYKSAIQGKKIAILGSTVPWYESMVLVYGGIPITIEYNKIVSEHPDIRTMTVGEFEKNPETFDAIFSISSFEHDGLGRYGDPINPNGDLLAMDKAKLMLRPGGLLFLAVPVGPDAIIWNAHRIYGKNRLKRLLDGWKVVETFGFNESDFNSNDIWHTYHGTHQPLFVLRSY